MCNNPNVSENVSLHLFTQVSVIWVFSIIQSIDRQLQKVLRSIEKQGNWGETVHSFTGIFETGNSIDHRARFNEGVQEKNVAFYFANGPHRVIMSKVLFFFNA